MRASGLQAKLNKVDQSEISHAKPEFEGLSKQQLRLS